MSGSVSHRMDGLSPLFSWRSAIASASGPEDHRGGDGEAVRGSTQRHVALTLSIHMSERGDSCFPGIARIARESSLSDRSVQRALRALEEGGWIAVDRGEGRDGTNLYSALIPDGYVHDEGVTPRHQGVTPRPAGGDATSPKSDSEGDSNDRTPLDPPPKPRTVDRKPVTMAEHRLAYGVLAAFNERAGTRYSSPDFAAKIVMRIREHPELDLEGHAAVIEQAFRAPWWRGAASPSVVYGNGGIFERTMQAAPAEAARFAGLDDV